MKAMGEDQLLVPTSPTPTPTPTNFSATREAVPPVSQQLVERKARPQKELALPCPRCSSTNTKFCYYNNYSLTQPRYFCKACKRYWTEGGSIRNVPVGGGSRKNKRRSTSSSIKNHLPPPRTPSSSSSVSLPPTTTTTTTSQPFNDQLHDLNLAYYPNHSHSFLNTESNNISNNYMELLGTCTGITTRGLGPPMPMHVPLTTMPPPPPEETSGAAAGVLHAAAGLFQLDGRSMQEGARRLLSPFGDVKQEQHGGRGGEQPVFWNGMMGAGAGSW